MEIIEELLDEPKYLVRLGLFFIALIIISNITPGDAGIAFISYIVFSIVAAIAFWALLDYQEKKLDYDELQKKYIDMLTYANELQPYRENYEDMQIKFEAMQTAYNDMQKENEALQATFKTMQTENDALQSSANVMQHDYNALQNSYKLMEVGCKAMQTQIEEMQTSLLELENLKTENLSLKRSNAALKRHSNE